MALGAETNAYMFIDTVCNGPMYPQGVCRIRKAAKPPTATQWASAPTRNRKFTLSGCGQGWSVMRSRMTSSVWRMPWLATQPTAATVSSTEALTMPSPPWKDLPSIARSCAIMALSRQVAIFAAQEGFAPSQTMPEAVASVLVRVISICSSVPPAR